MSLLAARTGRSRISHKVAVHPPFWGIDAAWRDSYDSAGFIAIFSRANYSIGISANASFTPKLAALCRSTLRSTLRWASKGESSVRFKSVLFVIVIASIPGISFAGKCDQVLANDQLIECLGNEFAKTDGVLNKAYNDLKTKLDRDGKALLKKGQVAWLTYRDKDCELQASAASGGQAYQPTYISCQTEKTARRIKELKESGW